jgi:hypothetical protein
LLTSNVDQPIIHKNTKIVFIPHGIGDECWDSIMDNYHKVLLAGKRPWSPGPNIHNWKIVGWAKSDVLFNPRSDRVEYVKNLMANLPYDQSILYISKANDMGPDLDLLAGYFKEHKINVIAPYRGYYQEAKDYLRHYNHILIPDILNLYYFAPYVKIVICTGFTSVGREFYLAKIPSIHLEKGYEESINLTSPDMFDPIFTQILNNPKRYIQPQRIIDQFFGIHDGKVVERIVKEIEE